MYNTSENFKTQTATSLIRRPKSKIIVGGVTYTGETALVTYPKISHSAEKIIGGFPAKTCTFELYDFGDGINLNGEEVAVYRGLEFDSGIEWVPMGIFKADDSDITANKTKRSISFKGYDRTHLFDVPFALEIAYPCTVARFAELVCNSHGIELETPNFPLSERVLLSAPNAPSGTSERELISRIAELGGCIAQISRLGGLRITQPQSTGAAIEKKYYKTVSIEPKFGEITAITLGFENRTDDIVYPESAAESSVNWRIEDNPFVDGVIAETDGITPTSRQTLIADIAENILGRSIYPFNVTDFVDDYVFDLNDAVTVKDKLGTSFETVILNLSTASRIKSNIGAQTQTSGSTNYKLAGSVKQQVNAVKLEVDHQEGTIKALVENFDELETSTKASLELAEGKISVLASTVDALEQETAAELEIISGQIASRVTAEELSSSITQLNNQIQIQFDNLADPERLSNSATNISADGIKVYNGKIEIYKGSTSSTEKVFGSDENGNLSVTGNIKVRFSNAYGSATSTLKITNEDYADDTGDYATASIKICEGDGVDVDPFAEIYAYKVAGVSFLGLDADYIGLYGKNVSIALDDNQFNILGTIQQDIGDINTKGTIVTNQYYNSSAFTGLRHYNQVIGGSFSVGLGIGKANSNASATGSIEVRDEYYLLYHNSNVIYSRLDTTKSTLRDDDVVNGVIDIRGRHDTYQDGAVTENYSKWLTLGKSTMYWPGDIMAKGTVTQSVSISSDETVKENIEALGSVLDIVCGAGIYSYNYISDSQTDGSESGDGVTEEGGDVVLETTEACYGLVIGEGYNTPAQVITEDGKHINLYSMISLGWKAIQELAAEISDIKSQLTA